MMTRMRALYAPDIALTEIIEGKLALVEVPAP